jgi:uncharacterized DUF497 family protein
LSKMGMFEDDEVNEIFIWDEKNMEHIARHGVETFEAEEAMLDEDRVKFNAHSGHFGLIGATEDGRRLVVIYIKKIARDAEAEEKKLYRRRKGR